MPGDRVHLFCPDGTANTTQVTLDGEPIPRIQRLQAVVEAGGVARLSVTMLAPRVDLEVPVEQVMVTIPLGATSVTIPLDRLIRWAAAGVPE